VSEHGRAQRRQAFWELADELYTDPAVAPSTMMGFPCLRVDGTFFASLEKDTNHLIVKLPAERVHALIDAGRGQHFAPNGRVFRDWVVVANLDRDEWRALLAEAKRFVE
jgi:hypothetical protein